jgi:glutamyl-tRNA reductase
LTTQFFVPEVVSIADACLGGLQDRSALLIGPEEQRRPYALLLQQANMKRIYQEDTPQHISSLLPKVQLLMHIPVSLEPYVHVHSHTLLTAASIAQGCIGRRTPLLIFDLANFTSVEELAGLLPAVCLYTPEDIHRILSRTEVQIS